MTKEDLASVTQKIYGLLEPLDATERDRVIIAAMTLLGVAMPQNISSAPNVGMSNTSTGQGFSSTQNIDQVSSPQDFFVDKDPQSKVEELAVAARYCEVFEGKEELSKEDIERIIRGAWRNFDSSNFKRDLNNAKTKGLFNRSREITLAHYGQEYIDSLPDRDSLKILSVNAGAKTHH